MDYSIAAAKIDHWHKPPVGKQPTYTTVDFMLSNSSNPARVVKNDSGVYVVSKFDAKAGTMTFDDGSGTTLAAARCWCWCWYWCWCCWCC